MECFENWILIKNNVKLFNIILVLFKVRLCTTDYFVNKNAIGQLLC